MMRRIRSLLAWCVSAATALGGAGAARAVIVSGANGTGSANTTVPFPISGLNNVGFLNYNPPSSAVYLGNGWGITAAHVGGFPPPPFTIPSGPGAGSYSSDAAVRINNADNTPSDLEVFHLTTTPDLPTLSLATGAPALGTSIFTMGYGLTRSANVQFYSVTGSGTATVWTPLPSSTGAIASGYTESTPNVLRWGTNITAAPPGVSGPTTTINAGFGNTTVFASTFDSSGTTSESDVSMGDSGGGVFNAANVLVGLNDVQFTFENQPGNTAIFGDQQGYVDIATYRSQIIAVTGIPEPSSLGLLAVGAAALLARRRRQAA